VACQRRENIDVIATAEAVEPRLTERRFTLMRQQLSRYLAKDVRGWFVEKESEPAPQLSLVQFMRIERSKVERVTRDNPQTRTGQQSSFLG
jgi:hypothetical protein